MAAEWISQTELASARGVHFAACLAWVGFGVFDRLLTPEKAAAPAWRQSLRKANAVLLSLALLSGIAWFLCVANGMGGDLNPATLYVVWTKTAFGTAECFRVLLFAGAALSARIALRGSRRRAIPSGFSLAVVVAFTASLAWTGHGGTGFHPLLHRSADAIHLIAAGIWPGGLLPLAIHLHRHPTDIGPLRRFSLLSLGTVALLTATGLVNTLCLMNSWRALFHTPYGIALLAKAALFLLMSGAGAANLLRMNGEGVSARILRTVRWELIGATAIVALVALLGILPPAPPRP